MAGQTSTTTSDGAATALTTNNTTITTISTAKPVRRPIQLSSSSTSTSTTPAATRRPDDQHHHQHQKSTSSKPNNNFHAHRQDHNPSKLPTFRFADLRKQSLALPSLVTQSQAIPPSPVSPRTDPNPQDPAAKAAPAHTANSQTPQAAQQHNRTTSSIPSFSTRHGSAIVDRQRSSIRRGPVSPRAPLSPTSSVVSQQHVASSAASDTSSGRSRPVSLLQTPRKSAFVPATRPVSARRPVSLGSLLPPSKSSESPSASDSATTIVSPRTQRPRELSVSRKSSAASEPQPPSASIQEEPLENAASDERYQGHKELTSPKSVRKPETHEKKGSISTRRPPVSYNRRSGAPSPTTATNETPSKIAPIRPIRTSGDRKSFGLSASIHSPNYQGPPRKSSHDDSTLQALEGRREIESLGMTPLDSTLEHHDADDSGDVFLNMAREEPESQPTSSRVIRSAHRRPLSSAIPPYQPMSPTQASRRMSDLENSRSKSRGEGQAAERPARALTFRSSLANGTTDIKNNSRVSPITPRTLTFQEPPAESTTSNSRRRQSNADSTAALPSRMSSLKQSAASAFSSGRTFNSSPLAPKTMEVQKPETQNGDHHTESSNSTAAPSTVWDEIDDIRSRIQRLELTGKLPPTSGAAMSRASEERPPTATTNATTMSGSPKHNGELVPQTDAVSTVSSSYGYKECQPLLQSAMSKSKSLLPPEIYNALENAASDAITLSTMIGKIGEPGPVSSAASNTGGPAVTDRQLRRKAESICRNLTELCLALSENQHQTQPRQPQPQDIPLPSLETGLAGSPMISRFSGGASSRRSSNVLQDRSPVIQAVSSPRAMSRLEERRSSMLFSSALPSPSSRYSSQTPVTPTEVTGRRTSLLVPRSRRGGTEEPEEGGGSASSSVYGHGRKSSLLLRSRRGGTEEADEQAGRRSSLLRTRRNVYDDEEDDRSLRIRAVSRTATELSGGPRPPVAQEFNPQIPMASMESAGLGASPMQRRRLGLSTINTRIQPTTNSGLASRRYMERETPDRESNNLAEKLAEDRGQRTFSGGQGGPPGRNGSLQRRLRDSVMTSNSAGQSTGYR